MTDSYPRVPMAALRAFLILLAILGFFLIGAPLQALVARRAPRLADVIPRLFCRSLLRLAKVDVALRGTRVRGPVLVVANHVSWIDILALRAVAPVCFLAKAEVARWPIVSTFAAVQGTVFVDRGRRRSIIPANAAMAARMAEDRPVLLFPEGTTTAGPEPGPFRSSHLAAAVIASGATHPSGRGRAVAVQPVAIVYSSAAAAWVGDDALLPHLWRILRGPRLACTVSFGAPIACSAASDRKALARDARASVVGLLAAGPVAQASRAAGPTAPAGDLGVAQAAGGR